MDDALRQTLKKRAAIWSLAYNVVLTILKFIAAALTGSVSLLSEAVHSATDVFASLFAFLSIRVSSAPPDEEHPYGHGKVESLAGFGESVMLLGIVAYILVEAAGKLVRGSQVESLGIGIAVMGLSAASALAVGIYVTRIGKRTESLALQSNGQHLMVDFWTSVGVMLALGITQLTGWHWTDPVFAIGFAVWIGSGAWKMVKLAYEQLIDRRIEDDEVEQVRRLLERTDGVISFHKLRTRHSGHWHYVDVHVVVPREWSLVRAHDLADDLETRIEELLKPAIVTIHVDPFDPRDPTHLDGSRTPV